MIHSKSNIIVLLIIIGELLVIEEFCCHGNLRDYLVTCRQGFVNEVTGNGSLGPPQKKGEQVNHEEIRFAFIH